MYDVHMTRVERDRLVEYFTAKLREQAQPIDPDFYSAPKHRDVLDCLNALKLLHSLHPTKASDEQAQETSE